MKLSPVQGIEVLLQFLHKFPTDIEHPVQCLTWREFLKKMRCMCILPLFYLYLHYEQEDLNKSDVNLGQFHIRM